MEVTNRGEDQFTDLDSRMWGLYKSGILPKRSFQTVSLPVLEPIKNMFAEYVPETKQDILAMAVDLPQIVTRVKKPLAAQPIIVFQPTGPPKPILDRLSLKWSGRGKTERTALKIALSPDRALFMQPRSIR